MVESVLGLDYRGCRALLEERLREPAPGRVQILTGPRQVGKTTLLLDLARHRSGGTVYAAADGPEARLPGFWERTWAEAEYQAHRRRKAYLFLDEVQHVADWAIRLKGNWDRLRRERIPLHVVVSGSSAVRLGAGSKESLAGRFERLTLNHWPASALVGVLGLGRKNAPRDLVRWGSYPGAVPLRSDPARWRAYVRDAIVEPAIGRDVLALGVVRKPALLRQVFWICVASPAQIVSVQKLRGRLDDPGSLETVAHYLTLLEDAYLVAALERYSARVIRRRSAPPKIVVLNNALLAAGDPLGAPDPSKDPARFGAWVENACLAHAWNQGQHVSYWREEPFEVDAILDGTWGRWAIEVKSGPFEVSDIRDLLEFCRREPRFRPLVVTGEKGAAAAGRAGVPSVTWPEFLLEGPPRD